MSQSHIIGVLFADEAQSGLTHDYFASVLEAFKRTIEPQGYDMIFINGYGPHGESETYLDQIHRRQCDGVLIACISAMDTMTPAVLDSGIPVVTIDQDYENVINVNSNNSDGIQKLTQYIIDQGHKNIAYIIGDDNPVTRKRTQGFLDTCKAAGIEIDPDNIKQCAYRDISKTAFYTEELLNLPDPPSCIIFSDDYAAIGGMNVIHARGLMIPSDISIAGYDGLTVMAQLQPRLTTIVQDTKRMGAMAGERLMAMIERPDETVCETITIDTLLEKGRTVGRVFF